MFIKIILKIMNGNKKKLIFGLSFILFFVGQFALEKLFVLAENNNKTLFFNTNLKIGDKNEDVRELQKILNKNPATRVSSFGVGSPNNESDFFGKLTKNAVIKFQELYASDILRPSGLVSGTGYVGTATRLKLNSLSKLNQTEAVVSKNSSSSVSYKVISKPEIVVVRVYNTSEYQVLPGSNVILTGEGFTINANTVFLGENRQISNLSSNQEGTKISFAVPKDLPLGKYRISVENSNGTSKSETIKIYILVTNSPAERPVVEKVEPREATYDSEITVFGKGFTTSGNSIHSMFGNVMNITSPDGKILKFKLSSMTKMENMRKENRLKNISIEVPFYIANDNGYNKDVASIVIKF